MARRLWLVLLALGLILPANGCGYLQAAGAVILLNQDDDDDPAPGTAGSGGVNVPPSVNVTTPSGNQTNNVTLSYLLIDAESDSANITVEYRFNAGAWLGAAEVAGAPSEGTTALTASPSGVGHAFVWNSFADVGGQNGTAELRVTPAGGASSATTSFTLLNRLIATAAGGATGTLNFPGAMATDSNGNLYIADTFNHQLQVLNLQPGSITVAGVSIPSNGMAVIAGSGVAGFNGDNQNAGNAQLNFPSGVALDPGDHIFIADSLNHRVRRIDRVSGFITTVAGSGLAGKLGNNNLATSAELDTPRSIAFDGATPPNLFISDTGNNVIRVVNRQSTTQTFPQTGGVAVAPNFMAFFAGNANLQGGQGDGAAAGGCRLNEPWGMAFDSNGHLYIAANKNHAVRVINMSTANVSILGVTIGAGDIDTVAGSNGQQGSMGDAGAATSARMRNPKGIALSAAGDLYVADSGNDRVRVCNAGGSSLVLNVTIAPGNIDTIAGGGASPGPNDGDGAAAILARCSAPEGLVVDGSGNAIVADTGLNRIRFVNTTAASTTPAGVTVAAGNIGTLAGTVTTGVTLLEPAGLVRTGTLLFIADRSAHRVLQLDLSTGVLTAVAGTGTAGFSGDNAAAAGAQLDQPRALALDGAGNLYIADWNNNRIRVINRTASSQSILNTTVGAGHIATVAGGGALGDGNAATSADITDSPGIAIDASGNLLIAHAAGNRIRTVGASSGTITTLAGNSTAGFAEGGATGSARFTTPTAIALDGAGNLLVVDEGNHAVRFVNLSGATVTVYPSAQAPATAISVLNGDVATIAGDPPATGPTQGFNGDNQFATATLLDTPGAVLTLAGGHLVVADTRNHRIRRIDAATGIVTTLAGTGTSGFNGDGLPPINAHLNEPGALFLDGSTPANLFFADAANRRVRRFTP